MESKSLSGRTVPLPLKLKDELKVQVKHVEELHQKDLDDGYGNVYLPYALERKYPNAKYETKWQFLFPVKNVVKDPIYKVLRRYHLYSKILGRNIKQAAVKSKVHKMSNFLHF